MVVSERRAERYALLLAEAEHDLAGLLEDLALAEGEIEELRQQEPKVEQLASEKAFDAIASAEAEADLWHRRYELAVADRQELIRQASLRAEAERIARERHGRLVAALRVAQQRMLKEEPKSKFIAELATINAALDEVEIAAREARP